MNKYLTKEQMSTLTNEMKRLDQIFWDGFNKRFPGWGSIESEKYSIDDLIAHHQEEPWQEPR